jgi:hypothetical protein
MMDFAVDPGSPTIHTDLGRTGSIDKALNRADLTIMSAQVEVHQSYEDMRTVVNLAKEVEDRTPEEQAHLIACRKRSIKDRLPGLSILPRTGSRFSSRKPKSVTRNATTTRARATDLAS